MIPGWNSACVTSLSREYECGYAVGRLIVILQCCTRVRRSGNWKFYFYESCNVGSRLGEINLRCLQVKMRTADLTDATELYWQVLIIG